MPERSLASFGSEGSGTCRLSLSQVKVGLRHYTWWDVLALLVYGTM